MCRARDLRLVCVVSGRRERRVFATSKSEVGRITSQMRLPSRIALTLTAGAWHLHSSPHRHCKSSSRRRSSSPTPPTWSSTLPTSPSARARVRRIPVRSIGRHASLTRAQRSTGTMRSGGSFTATGTGCGRYVYSCLWARAGRYGFKDREVTAAGGALEDDMRRPIPQNKRLTQTKQAPEVQTMYSLNLPVSTLRTKIRQEFERHRYVNQLRTVDVLLFSSHQEFQVRTLCKTTGMNIGLIFGQETLNYWKQTSHVLKYFRAEEDPKARLPSNFINGFLEVRATPSLSVKSHLTESFRVATESILTAPKPRNQEDRVYSRQYHSPSVRQPPCYL